MVVFGMVCWTVAFGINVAILAHLWQNRWYNEVADLDRDRSKGSRVAGKNEIHRRLQIDEFTEEPRLVFFNNCTECISQIPTIPLDKKNPEDVDTNALDHMYDALRYGVMTRPRRSLWDFNPATQKSGFQASDPKFGY